MKTGEPVWDTKLIESEKLTVGFTGAPLVVKDKVIIGAQGGEWPYRGPIFGVDGKTGKKAWEFLTVAGTDEAMQTWGGDPGRPAVAAVGWRAPMIPRPTRLSGARQPGTALRLGGVRVEDQGAAARDNLYTSSVIGLDPDRAA